MQQRIEELVVQVLERKPERILLQVPEGLKTRAQEIKTRLAQEDIETVISLDPCYGACDIKDREAIDMGCDLLLHLGHSEYMESDIETLYFPWYFYNDPEEILRENIEELSEYIRIGLIGSINFMPCLETAKTVLESEGVDVLIGPSKGNVDGQILGCDIKSAKTIESDVDAFLYIGSGRFHALGVAHDIDKPVYVLDFEQEKIYRPDFDIFKRQSMAAIGRAKDAERFGIIVSSKRGQTNMDNALTIKGELEERDRKAWIFSMDYVDPEKFVGINIDCLVNTACPRIAIEHRTDFKVPILNPDEFYRIWD